MSFQNFLEPIFLANHKTTSHRASKSNLNSRQIQKQKDNKLSYQINLLVLNKALKSSASQSQFNINHSKYNGGFIPTLNSQKSDRTIEFNQYINKYVRKAPESEILAKNKYQLPRHQENIHTKILNIQLTTNEEIPRIESDQNNGLLYENSQNYMLVPRPFMPQSLKSQAQVHFTRQIQKHKRLDSLLRENKLLNPVTTGNYEEKKSSLTPRRESDKFILKNELNPVVESLINTNQLKRLSDYKKMSNSVTPRDYLLKQLTERSGNMINNDHDSKIKQTLIVYQDAIGNNRNQNQDGGLMSSKPTKEDLNEVSIIKEMEQMISFESEQHPHLNLNSNIPADANRHPMFVTTPIQQIRFDMYTDNNKVNVASQYSSRSGRWVPAYDDMFQTQNLHQELKKLPKLVNFKNQEPKKRKIVKNKSLGPLLKQRAIVANKEKRNKFF
ncbi:UNKNOWN [Stylonychia lemnae]|uniref:Uncharacterized protein n=1 Tax=Stylonychia lemnae TaxID=5949 RepID=A0A077ZTP5_STYLE|nr:UNKNOWN [Stylonychia lemnae]|eukprot:CDW72710.1 UNKNOWN [Stylonychia lemnae]